MILSIEQAEGSVYDFTLYKNSTGAAVSSDVKIKADSGYQGIAAYHANSEVPFKKSKKCPLPPEEKRFTARFTKISPTNRVFVRIAGQKNTHCRRPKTANHCDGRDGQSD